MNIYEIANIINKTVSIRKQGDTVILEIEKTLIKQTEKSIAGKSCKFSGENIEKAEMEMCIGLAGKWLIVDQTDVDSFAIHIPDIVTIT